MSRLSPHTRGVRGDASLTDQRVAAHSFGEERGWKRIDGRESCGFVEVITPEETMRDPSESRVRSGVARYVAGSSMAATSASASDATVMCMAAGSRTHAISPRAVRSSSSNWNALAWALDW